MLWQFLVLLFVQGIAICEAFKLYEKEDSLSLKLGFAIGTSLSTTTVFIAMWNTFVGAVTLQLANAYTVASIVCASFALIVGERRIITKPTRYDLSVSFCAASVGLLGYLALTKFPIFPKFNEVDFIWATSLSQDILKGTTAVSQSLLYYGLHYNLALALVGSQELSIVTTRAAMVILSAAAAFILYGTAERIFKSKMVGATATALFAFPAFIWTNTVYYTGTWPNFFGLIISLFALLVFESIKKYSIKKSAVFTALVFGALAFSHYTSVFVIPSLISYLVIKRSEIRKFVVPTAILALGSVFAMVLFGREIFALTRLLNSEKSLAPITWLGSFLPPSSMLSIVTVFDDDFAFVALAGLAVVGIALTIKSKGVGAPATVWLALITVVSSFSTDWRYAYIVMVPMLLLAANGLNGLAKLNISGRISRDRFANKEDRRWTAFWSAMVILLLFGSGSGGLLFIQDVTSYPTVATIQRSVYVSMAWTNANLGTLYPQTKVISNAWQFAVYFPLLFGRTMYFYPFSTNRDVEKLANQGYRLFMFTNVTIPKDAMATINSTGDFRLQWTDGLTKLYSYGTPNQLFTTASGGSPFKPE